MPQAPRSRFRARAAALLAAAAAVGANIANAEGPASAPGSRTAVPETFPLYAAAPAAPVKLHYRMTRGMWSGGGDLIWKPAGERYELRLEAAVAGLSVLTEVSTGRLGRHGLEPARYTDQRLRHRHVAEFARDRGRITYAGHALEVPLPPGAQDRLSWMLQLGAVVNADPRLAAPGGTVVFFVTGARADADTWAFRYAGTETMSAAGGVNHAVKFTREPRQANDRLVEIWLAPARQHLPVRARFTAEADGEVFELLLRDIGAP
jgi:hypothetical protein